MLTEHIKNIWNERCFLTFPGKSNIGLKLVTDKFLEMS